MVCGFELVVMLLVYWLVYLVFVDVVSRFFDCEMVGMEVYFDELIDCLFFR